MTPTRAFFTFDGRTISVDARSLAEARIAIKQLRTLKAELGIKRRLLAAEQKQIRASYTEYVRTRGSVVRGGGGLGGIVRLIQTRSRDNHRAELARQLAPLEEQKALLERQILLAEKTILQVQAEILRREA